MGFKILWMVSGRLSNVIILVLLAKDNSCETLFVAVDPYLAGQIRKNIQGPQALPLGALQRSYTVAKVIDSKNASYPTGTVFSGATNPWKKYFLVSDEKELNKVKILQLPNQPETIYTRLGYQSALSIFGMPAQTAYYGVLDVGKFTEKDVVVVSGAAGAVGLAAGQIAKHIIKCKKVIGVAGSNEKCELLVKEFGLDAAINYKEYNTKDKMAAKLVEVAGEPITAYYDNTGGVTTDAVLEKISKFGKVVICGLIGILPKLKPGEKLDEPYDNYLINILYRSLSVTGFIASDHLQKNDKAFYPDMEKWVENGQVKPKETILLGFENVHKAFQMLLNGGNTGKVIVKV